MTKPACTATIEGDNVLSVGTTTCTRKAGHRGSHVGRQGGQDELLWNDNHDGATPHGAASQPA